MQEIIHSGIAAEMASSSESENQPKYERLREYVVSQIESGLLKAGAALPSENRLAETLQIARSTVRQALAALERDGLVRRVHGKGTFVHDQARSRVRKGQDLFALIVPETEAAFYPSLQKSFAEAAGGLSSQVIVCNSGNDVDRQGNSILQLMDLRVAGVAIIPPTNPPTPAYHVRQLQQHGIPVVCCSRPVIGAQAPLLAIPFEVIGQRAGEEISRAGHKRVAFLGSTQGEAVQAYELGFRKALGARVTLQTFCGSVQAGQREAHEQEVSQALESLFTQAEPPTAIFCSFDSLAELVFLWLSQRGLWVPQDVSVVGVGGKTRGAGLAGRLTSVTLDEVALGQAAVRWLDQMRTGEIPLDHNEIRYVEVSFSRGNTLQEVSHAR